MSADYKDAVITELADSEAQLIADVVTYRMMALATLDELATLRQQHERLTERYERLLDEYRTLRAHMMRQAVAA